MPKAKRQPVPERIADDLRIDIETACKAMEAARESFQRYVNDVVKLKIHNEQLVARVQELLEANNREVERRRQAEAEASRLRLLLSAGDKPYALWVAGVSERGVAEKSASVSQLIQRGMAIKPDALVATSVLRGGTEVTILVLAKRVCVTDSAGEIIWKRDLEGENG